MTTKSRGKYHLEHDKYYLEHAEKDARELILTMAETFKRAAAEMERYAERGESSLPEEVLSWAVNAAICVAPNLRIDLAVSYAARIAKARQRIESAEMDAG